MAIQTKAAVETEYAAKRDAILVYPTASLDDDLAKLELLATRVDECLAVLGAREALSARPTSTPTIQGISEAAAQLRRIPTLVREYVAKIREDLASVDVAVGP
jgi:hypothetical protein